MNGPMQAVAFDLGNVLVRIQTDAVWTELGIEAGERERFLPAVHDAVIKLENGFMSPEAFFAAMQSTCGSRFTRAALEQAFTSIIREPIDGMEEVVRKVSERHRTALVSNTNLIHYEYALRTVPAMLHLHDHFVSFRMGVMKPAAGFYELIVNRMNVPPDSILFIDDLPENVEGALRAGLRGHQFHSCLRLVHELKQLEIL